MKYVPREQFVPLHNRTQRWAAVNTHRCAGKTVALVNDLIFGALECRLHRPQLAYIGPTYSQAKKVAWQYVKDFVGDYLAKPPQEAELKVTLKNDATIHVLGADNADSLRGMYLDGAVLDEYAMYKPSVFSQVIRPALSDRNGWAVFISTPRGKNLFYDVCQQAAKDPKTWFGLTLRADESGIIPATELFALRKDMDPEEYAQEYLCSFDSALKGSIYADQVNQMFEDGRVVSDSLYDANLPCHCAFDLGFTDATVCIWFQIGKDSTVRLVAAEATTGTDIFYHIEKINQFEGEVGDIWLPHDARAKNLQTGRSIMEQFLSEGVRPKIVPQHKVRDGISATRKMFPRIYLQETSTGELLEAMKAYRRSWDENHLIFSDIPLHDWASDWCDCLRYVCIAAGLIVPELVIEEKKAPKTGNVFKFSDYGLDQLHEDRVLQLGGRRIV